MVAKQITKEDLQNLEIRVKSDIRKENMEDRHNLDNKLGDYFFKVDGLVSKDLLNDNIIKTMSDNFKELKDMVKELSDNINRKFDGLDTKFATTDHVERVELRVETMEKDKKNIMVETLKYIAMAIGGMCVAFITYKLGLK